MPDDREPLGRLVHETRLGAEADRAADEGRARFVLGTWEERDDWQRELDMRIGSAVAARAVQDAGLRNDRRDAQLFALRSHLPAVLEALRFAEERDVIKSWAKRFEAALEALGGGEEQS